MSLRHNLDYIEKLKESTENGTASEDINATISIPNPHPVCLKFSKSVAFKMLKVIRNICVLMLAILSTYANFHKSTKIVSGPNAVPFFPENSIVVDWFRGETTKLFEQAVQADVTFIMFYAPWSGECQLARKEFELAASVMGNVVQFLAINCWQPNGECRHHYSKIRRWPTLMAYAANAPGIYYNGPITAAYIIRFLNVVCFPILRPKSIAEVFGSHDIIVSAHVNPVIRSQPYGAYYLSALKYLELDPLVLVRFVVFPQAAHLNKSLVLHLYNGTIAYKEDVWDAKVICTWILRNLYFSSMWVTPLEVKNTMLFNVIQSMPTVILFTPRNPQIFESDYYNMLKSTAYDYYNCANSTKVNNIQKSISVMRYRNYMQYKQLSRTCTQYVTDLNTTDQFSANQYVNISLSTGRPMCRSCLKQCDENLEEKLQRYNCKIFLSGQQYTEFLYVKPMQVSLSTFLNNNSTSTNISGLACNMNQSLHFIAIDSLRHHYFAERLGVDILARTDKSAVVIVNDKTESHYVMNHSYTVSNVKQFIFNYSTGLLNRALDSPLDTSSNNNNKNNNKSTNPNTNSFEPLKCQSNICIRNVKNSSDFMTVISQPNKVILVYYVSKQCAFCSGISHIVLSVATMLKHLNHSIQFVKIDSDKILLPWEYTMDVHPTILFLPYDRKSDSVVFPNKLPVTIQNLLGFLATNLKYNLKVEVMLSACKTIKLIREKVACVTTIKEEIINMMTDLLQNWNTISIEQKSVLLGRLESLQEIYLMVKQEITNENQGKEFLTDAQYDIDTKIQNLIERSKHLHDEL